MGFTIKITDYAYCNAPKRTFHNNPKRFVPKSGGMKWRIKIEGLNSSAYFINATKILNHNSNTPPKLGFFASVLSVVLQVEDSQGQTFYIKANRGSLERLGFNKEELRNADKFPTLPGAQAFVYGKIFVLTLKLLSIQRKLLSNQGSLSTSKDSSH